MKFLNRMIELFTPQDNNSTYTVRARSTLHERAIILEKMAIKVYNKLIANEIKNAMQTQKRREDLFQL